MAKFCVHEQNGGVCKNTGTYCNLGSCPYEDLKEFTVVRHGKWIEKEKDGFLHYSNCGYVRIGIPIMFNFEYCPKCGAKMG